MVGKRTKVTNKQIELVARRLCVEQGIDPDDQEGCGILDAMTNPEKDKYLKDNNDFVFDVMVFQPKWRLKRSDAESMLSGT
jgi:hypothetical protein